MGAKASWLEISLIVDGEMAEAVAEVLGRFVPRGVIIESTDIASDPKSEGRPVGPLRVSGYLPVDAEVAETRRRIEEALWHLGRISPLPQPQIKTVQETDWTQSWKQHYHPIPIGRKLLIVPAWLDPPDESRIPIRIEPGMAFGTGTHPSTQLCLGMLEAEKLTRVIDVGCGSGILSIAALKLGAERVLGVDSDPEAIASARENAALNSVGDKLELEVGSVSDIRAGKYSLNQAPLVLANILAPILLRLLEEGLGGLVLPRGTLVLSGILEEQEPLVLEASRARGFDLKDRRQIEDWVALSLAHV